MRLYLFVFLLLSLPAFANEATANSNLASRSAFPEIDQMNAEMAKLREQLKSLTDTINQHGSNIDSNWRNTNQELTVAVGIVNERFTVGTLVGLAIAIGIVPALVHLAYLPIIYRVIVRAVRQGQVGAAQ